jgi:hypothetical protein
MTDRPRSLGAAILLAWSLIVIVGGFFANLHMTMVALQHNAMVGAALFGVCAIGCAVLCYRTYMSRDELRSNLKS